MNISQDGIALIKRFEGCRLEAYLDSVKIPTIAYGRTKNLKQCQFDALCSWVYNLGPTNLRESTLLKVLNEGNYNSVPAEIKRWNKAGGKVLEGLMRRRRAEALLFEDKEWLGV